MDVWIVDALDTRTKNSTKVGVVFDETIAKLISQQSNDEIVYTYRHEFVCGKLYAIDKDSWMGRQVKKGDT